MDRHWRAELALAGIALIWGATFVLVKTALADISASLFLAFRFSIAAVLLGGAFALTRRRKEGAASLPWLPGCYVGLALFAGYLLQTLGLRHTTPAKSGFITGLYIVFVPLLQALVYRRSPSAAEWAGVAAAVSGLGLLTVDFATLALSRGDLLTVGCAVAFAIHMMLLSHFSKRLDSGWLALTQVASCAAAAWLAGPVIETAFVRWSPVLLVALAVTSVLATAVAFYIQTWGQSHTTVTRAAIIFALEPLFAWLTSYVLGGEILNARSVAGAGCILTGILLVELKPLESRAHPL